MGSKLFAKSNSSVPAAPVRRSKLFSKSNAGPEKGIVPASLSYLKGFGQQGLNSAENIGASAGNVPASLWESATGNRPYNIPHPKDLPPAQSIEERGGRSVAKAIPDLLPFLGAMKAASAVPKAAEGASALMKILHGTGKLAAGGAGGAGTAAAINEENRGEAAETGALEGIGGVAAPAIFGAALNPVTGRNVTKAEAALQKAMIDMQKKEGSLAGIKGEAKGNQLPTDVNVYPHRIANKQEQLQQAMQEHAGIPKEEFPSQVTHEAHTQLVPQAEQHAENVDNLISRFLNHGGPNDEELAQQVAYKFEGRPGANKRRSGGLKQDLGRVFDSIENDFKGKTITTTNLPTASMTDKQLEQLADEKLGVHANPKLREEFINKSREATMNESSKEEHDAVKYYKKYRTLLLESGEDRARAHRGGLTPEAYDEWIDRSKQKADEAEHMEKVLKEQIGGEPIKRLNAIKKRYSEEYAPLNENEIYQKMVHGEKVDARDLAHALRGNAPGNAILRNYIRSNPDAAYLMASHEFSGHPERLQNLNQTQRQYINEQNTPELHQLIQAQMEARNAIPIAAAQQHHFTELHKTVQNAFKEHQQSMERVSKLEKDIPRLQKEIQQATVMEKKLRAAEGEKGISKEVHEKRKRELEKAIVKREKIRNKLTKLTKGALVVGLEEWNRRNPKSK